MCSLLSSTSPHFPLQEPSGAQQLDSPFGLVPHLGHLAVGVFIVVITAVVVVPISVQGVQKKSVTEMCNKVKVSCQRTSRNKVNVYLYGSQLNFTLTSTGPHSLIPSVLQFFYALLAAFPIPSAVGSTTCRNGALTVDVFGAALRTCQASIHASADAFAFFYIPQTRH